jgi:hypothetical protein
MDTIAAAAVSTPRHTDLSTGASGQPTSMFFRPLPVFRRYPDQNKNQIAYRKFSGINSLYRPDLPQAG